MNDPACPACATTTRFARFDDVIGFSCEHCQGHTLRGEQIRKLLARNGISDGFTTWLAVVRASKSDGRNLVCPDCGAGRFRIVRAAAADVDVCTGCGSAYFDRGEIQKYLREPRLSRAGESFLDGAGNAIDVIDVILTILSNLHH